MSLFIVTAALAVKMCPVCKTEYGGGEVFCPVDATRLSTPSQMPAAVASESNDPLIGTTLAGRYEVVRQIGEGGMGLVYEGRHCVIEKRVAIKVLREDFSRKPDVVERFRQEAKSASRIGDAHIIDIHDFGETPTGASYFVMEFLEGEDLANVLAREGVIETGRAIEVALQCCRALGAAHAKNIIHRDMKPENVFLTQREGGVDFAKIVDFGIAKMSDIETDGAPGRKLTKTGMIFGTPEYMSPEQAQGKELDHRVDVYAIGVILYECVTGRVPFVGDSFMGILTQHMFEDPPPLLEANPATRCGPELEMVIFKALAKDPNERFGSMAELAEALEDAKHGFVSEATRTGFRDAIAGAPKSARTTGPSATGAFQTETAQPRPSSSGRWVGALLALLVAGGAAAYFLVPGLSGPPTSLGAAPDVAPLDPAAAAPSEAAAAEAAAAEAAAAEAAAAEAAAAEAAAAEVAAAEAAAAEAAAAEAAAAEAATIPLRVITRPVGARASVVDGPSCEPTPCALDLAPGEEVTITARLGRTLGRATLIPGEQDSVSIPLRRGGRPSQMDSSQMGSSVMMRRSGDLKIPSVFQ